MKIFRQVKGIPEPDVSSGQEETHRIGGNPTEEAVKTEPAAQEEAEKNK